VIPSGTLEEIEAARLLIPARTALLAVQGAGHDLFRAPKHAGGDAVAGIVTAFFELVG
jgi:hypothetical protein